MAEYKIGDQVRVVKDLDPGWEVSMIGTTGEVVEVDDEVPGWVVVAVARSPQGAIAGDRVPFLSAELERVR